MKFASLYYALAVPIGLSSYFVTRGRDGEFLLCLELFGLWSAVYLAQCLIGAKRLREMRFPMHIVVYLVAAVGPLFMARELDEMGGMLLGIVPLCALTVPVPGVVALAVRSATAKRSPP